MSVPTRSCHLDFTLTIGLRGVQESFQYMVDDVSELEEATKANEEFGKYAIERFMKDTERYDEVPEQHIEPDKLGLDAGQKQQDDGPNSGLSLDFMLQTSAYKWLVAILKRETTLMRACPDLMGDIEARILRVLPLPSKNLSRKTSSQECKATFELLWSPLQYLKEQQYDESPEEAFEGAITLTGTVNDAQALTALEYLCQVWPTSGIHIMQLITDVACSVPERFATSKRTSDLPTGTYTHSILQLAYQTGQSFKLESMEADL
jgi:hypothetical protein